MKYKKINSVALDMDGTLLDSRKKVSCHSLSTIIDLIDQGIKVTIVTGKAYDLTIHSLIPLKLPVVCLDGAMYVLDGVKRWTPNSFIPTSIVYDILTSNELSCYLISNGAVFVRGNIEERQYRDWSDKIFPLESDTKLNLVTHLVFPHKDKTVLDELYEQLRKKPRIELLLSSDGFFGFSSLFVRSPFCTKLNGARKLFADLSVSLDETLFIGDWLNDIPLLSNVGFAVAMRDAPDEVFAVADAVTLYSNDENGVSLFLRKFFSLP